MSRLRFRMRKAFMNLAMILGLFPAFMSMVAVYFILKAVGLTEGSGLRIALILIYSAGSGVGFYIAKGFFDTVPKSLSEAAILDGCNQFQVFYKIILPLSKPIVVYTIQYLSFGPTMTRTNTKSSHGARNAVRIVYTTGISDSIIDAILNRFIQWLFKSIYDGIANFFTQISNMGTEIFDLSWVQAVVKLFSLFGWSIFVVGVVVSAFDLTIEYQTGRANIKTTALNWIKGFMAVSLFTITPIELYKFCVSLQNTFAKDLVTIAAGEQYVSLGSLATKVLVSSFNPGGTMISAGLFELVTLIALGFFVFKIFFDNIKRGGILHIQLAVGSLYMFSIPRGYGDGFNNWVKQVFALCLTAFLQTTDCKLYKKYSATLDIIKENLKYKES